MLTYEMPVFWQWGTVVCRRIGFSKVRQAGVWQSKGVKIMEKFNVTIKGIRPLLMHSPMALMNAKPGMKKNQAVDPQVEAEGFLYKNEQGKVVVPSMAILGCMKAAGSDFKYEGKKTYKNLIYPGVRVYPEEWIPLTYEEWKPDLKIVVNPSTGGRQVRARPRGKTPSMHSKHGQPTSTDERRWARRRALLEKYGKQRQQEMM